jgi:hypothetical protein
MRYEFRSANGQICCRANNPEYLCAKCKAMVGTPRAAASNAGTATLRTAERKTYAEWVAHFTSLEGRRHNADDTQSIQDMHDEALALGADCDDTTREDPIQALHNKSVILGAECDGSAAELRDQAAFEMRHATLRKLPPPRTRVVEVPDLVDPYATAIPDYSPEPSDFPGYQPYGTPPNGHLIALAVRSLEQTMTLRSSPATWGRIILPRVHRRISTPWPLHER